MKLSRKIRLRLFRKKHYRIYNNKYFRKNFAFNYFKLKY